MSTRESEQILGQLNDVLAREFNINHTTIQFESETAPIAAHYVPVTSRPNDS